jgi:bacteriorhodopsin
MNPFDTPTPELQTLSLGNYDLVFYSLVVTAFAMFAMFVYTWNSKSEIGARYRPAVLASLCIVGVAGLSYLVLALKWNSGFDLVGNVYQPNAEARATLYPRYIDWTVTVPLLTAELLAVGSLAGAKARNLRFSTMGAAVLMIFTGFMGSQVLAQGRDTGALVLWGCISTVFYIYLYVALIGSVRRSLPTMSPEAGASYRNATILLLATWGVYPLVYAIPVFFDVTPAWLVGIQLAFSVTDITAKVGFGALIHKVAKLRTAEDVAAGTDTHPESIWISNEHKSEGVLPQVGKVAPELMTRFADNHAVEREHVPASGSAHRS